MTSAVSEFKARPAVSEAATETPAAPASIPAAENVMHSGDAAKATPPLPPAVQNDAERKGWFRRALGAVATIEFADALTSGVCAAIDVLTGLDI